jgi:NADH-quinone oxidoreductase subunit A
VGFAVLTRQGCRLAETATSQCRLRGARSVNAYAPILVLGALGAGFAIFSVVMATLIGPKRYNRAKLDAYECGIEIVFLYPWAVTFDALGVFGLVEMLLFVLTVFVAYAYVWRRGGLEWD